MLRIGPLRFFFCAGDGGEPPQLEGWNAFFRG